LKTTERQGRRWIEEVVCLLLKRPAFLASKKRARAPVGAAQAIEPVAMEEALEQAQNGAPPPPVGNQMEVL
jgi:hypothetical protein